MHRVVTAETLTGLPPDMRYVVEQAWEGWESPLESLLSAWDESSGNPADTTSICERHDLALIDVARMNDITRTAVSPNWQRDHWLRAVTDVSEIVAGTWSRHVANQIRQLLTDAELVADPLLGLRMTAEVAAMLFAVLAEADRYVAACNLTDTLYAVTRPDTECLLTALRTAPSFVWRGRIYCAALNLSAVNIDRYVAVGGDKDAVEYRSDGITWRAVSLPT